MEKRPDLLDVLRRLNEKNINDDPQVRANFFKNLIEMPMRRTEYPAAWDRVSVDGAIENIMSHLPSDSIIDKNTHLEIEYGKESNLIEYIYGIMKIERLVETDPMVFSTFKKGLLIGLIMKCIIKFYFSHCQEEGCLDTLNKLMVILGEHIYCLEPNDDEPYIIDDIFLNKLKDTIEKFRPLPYYSHRNEFEPIVFDLIKRVFGGGNKKARYEK